METPHLSCFKKGQGRLMCRKVDAFIFGKEKCTVFSDHLQNCQTCNDNTIRNCWDNHERFSRRNTQERGIVNMFWQKVSCLFRAMHMWNWTGLSPSLFLLFLVFFYFVTHLTIVCFPTYKNNCLENRIPGMMTPYMLLLVFINWMKVCFFFFFPSEIQALQQRWNKCLTRKGYYCEK